MFVPGVITLILTLICALMTSVTITKEKEFGTMEVLLVSPLKPLQIILGKVTPYFLLSFINVIFILLLSFFVFDSCLKGAWSFANREHVIYSDESFVWHTYFGHFKNDSAGNIISFLD